MDHSLNFRTVIALALITLAGLGLRLYDISANSLMLDEGYTLFLAKKSPGAMVRAIMADDNHPPLHYLLMRYWIKIAGRSEFALRLPSAVFGALSVLAMYALAAAAFGSGPGLASAFILALSRYHISLSQEARGYSLMVLLCIISFFFFLKMQKKPDKKNIALYVVSSVLLFYTHYYGAFAILGQLLYGLSRYTVVPRPQKAGYAKTHALVFGLVALPCSLWLPVMMFRAGAEAPLSRFSSILTKEIFLAFGTYAGSIPVMVVFACIALVWFFQHRRAVFATRQGSNGASAPGLLWQKLNNSAWAIFLYWGIAMLVVPYLLSFFTVPLFTRRCAVTASIPFYILIGFFLCAIKSRPLLIVLTAGLFLACLREDGRYFSKPVLPQWKECVQKIDAVKKEEDALVFSPAGYKDLVFSYYSNKPPSHCFYFPAHGDAPLPHEGEALIDTLKKYPVIYFPRVSEILFNGALETMLRGNFYLKDSLDFRNLILYTAENPKRLRAPLKTP
jgi:4-amino-4-deoxy-L-arabinose transferase-like glycosyltransferase